MMHGPINIRFLRNGPLGGMQLCLVSEHRGGSCYGAKQLDISHCRNVNNLASLAAAVNAGLCRAYVYLMSR